jgi:hypothetical protein
MVETNCELGQGRALRDEALKWIDGRDGDKTSC